jgi:predicted CoA-binding protein
MKQAIDFISSQRHIAVVGVSDRSFGGEIYKNLKQRGYSVYAVHPTREVFRGDSCYSSLKNLPEEVKAAVVAVSPDSAESVVDDAASSAVTHLWFQQGKDFSQIVATAQAKGLQTVSRKCILMYAKPVTGVHAFHRTLARLFGRL